MPKDTGFPQTDAQFDFAPDTSFDAAATAIHDKAVARDGAAAAEVVREAFAARGITVTP